MPDEFRLERIVVAPLADTVLYGFAAVYGNS